MSSRSCSDLTDEYIGSKDQLKCIAKFFFVKLHFNEKNEIFLVSTNFIWKTNVIFSWNCIFFFFWWKSKRVKNEFCGCEGVTQYNFLAFHKTMTEPRRGLSWTQNPGVHPESTWSLVHRPGFPPTKTTVDSHDSLYLSYHSFTQLMLKCVLLFAS